ncbi:HD-GYP domain-containing protein [Soehngenia saccharolytica]|nr:HD-GYP domain-containing protein [Soehngenia saccharolytica]
MGVEYMLKSIDLQALNKDNRKELIRACNDLKDILEFKDWEIIVFNDENDFGFRITQNIGDKSDMFHLNKNNIYYFDNNIEDDHIKKLFKERKVLFIGKDENVSEAEIYIPLFMNKDNNKKLIGTLHFTGGDGDLDIFVNKLQEDKLSLLVERISDKYAIHYVSSLEEEYFKNFIHLIFEIINEKDPLMKSHPYNVAYLSNLLGQTLGFPQERLEKLYMAALLHDVGKLFIDSRILNKKEPLTDEERKEIEKHCEYGYSILKDMLHINNPISGIENVVLQHHERFDGLGYPNGVKGNNILLESRIIFLADAVDAMLSKRAYRDESSIDNVINQVRLNAGKQFDPKLSRLMINILVNNKRMENTILEEPLLLGTLVVPQLNGIKNLQGILIKKNIGYEFKVNINDLKENGGNIEKASEAVFYTQSKGMVYEYDAKIINWNGNNIYISDISPKPSANFFSMSWEIEGNLIIGKSIGSTVTINKIGGDSLSFYLEEEDNENIDFDFVNAIIIKFDEENTLVQGEIIRTIKIENKIYADFKFIGIQEATRDVIFRQIFRKQAELKKRAKDLFEE